MSVTVVESSFGKLQNGEEVKKLLSQIKTISV